MIHEGEAPIFCGEGGWGFISLKQAKNPDMAIEFLRLLVTDEGQTSYAMIYGGQPNTAWKGLVGNYDHFVDNDPDGPLGRADEDSPGASVAADPVRGCGFRLDR